VSKVLQPEGWRRPSGYANGVRARGEMVFVAGQLGWDQRGEFEATDLPGQTRRALENVRAVLACAGARPEHVARMTWYVTDMEAYRAQRSAIGAAYRSVMGSHYPAMTLVQVAGLVEPRALVEIEVTAVLPEGGGG